MNILLLLCFIGDVRTPTELRWIGKSADEMVAALLDGADAEKLYSALHAILNAIILDTSNGECRPIMTLEHN